MTAETAHALVGTVLDGSYRIEGLLGAGGMGAVYAAKHLRLDKRVAVKVMARELTTNAGNNAIREITASGVVTTIVGVASPTSTGNFPDPLPASMVSPDGVAIDPSTGKLYITLPDAVMVAVLPK